MDNIVNEKTLLTVHRRVILNLPTTTTTTISCVPALCTPQLCKLVPTRVFDIHSSSPSPPLGFLSFSAPLTAEVFSRTHQWSQYLHRKPQTSRLCSMLFFILAEHHQLAYITGLSFQYVRDGSPAATANVRRYQHNSNSSVLSKTRITSTHRRLAASLLSRS
jgi:hypothetical protein